MFLIYTFGTLILCMSIVFHILEPFLGQHISMPIALVGGVWLTLQVWAALK